jgi:acetyl-CoA C-acetyltransferase
MKGKKLARKVSIIGAAYTPLGDVRETPEIKDFSEREMVAMAGIAAMKNGGIEAKDIDAFYVACSGPNTDAKMKGGGPFFAEWLGMKYKPTMFLDAGCVGGGVALNSAVGAVAGGMYDAVLVTGVNINMSMPKSYYPPHIRFDYDNETLWDNVYLGMDAAYIRPSTGGLAPYDSDLMVYSKTYGISLEEIDEAFLQYLIDKRREAVLNPKAALTTESFEEEGKRFGFDNAHDYLKSKKYNPFISYTGRGKFMGWAMDGAAAVVVCASDLADKYTDKPVEVAGISVSCSTEKDYPSLKHVEDMTMFEEAYMMADITDPFTQIDHMYIHDCPTLTIPIIMEQARYVKPGTTIDYMKNGDFTFDGKRPLNTTGGRTQAGHPRSPAYLMEISESIEQMRGECGPRQMPIPPKTSLLWGGGSGVSKTVTVLKKQW